MKRSEAIRRITERLKEENLTRISANSQEEDLAIVLLNYVERELNMPPPFSAKAFELESSFFLNAHGNNWDPEDEH